MLKGHDEDEKDKIALVHLLANLIRAKELPELNDLLNPKMKSKKINREEELKDFEKIKEEMLGKEGQHECNR